MSRGARGAVAAIALAFAGGAAAQSCAGFADVDAASPFCPNVEWVRNRGITLGCGNGTLYCPGANVSRLAMAAFMRRLGDASTPVVRRVAAATGAITLGAAPVVCAMQEDVAPAQYPVRVLIDSSLRAVSDRGVNFSANLAVSSDGGATWADVNGRTNMASTLPGHWLTVADFAHADVGVGQRARWGIRVWYGPAPDFWSLLDSACSLRVVILPRTGTTPPY